jgi:hypothetical protein
MSTETFHVIAGSSWPFTSDQITDVTGADVTDVSAWACEWAIEPIAGGADVLTKSTTAGTILRGSGLFSWIVSATDSSAVPVGFYKARTIITDASGNKQAFHSYLNVKPLET